MGEDGILVAVEPWPLENVLDVCVGCWGTAPVTCGTKCKRALLTYDIELPNGLLLSSADIWSKTLRENNDWLTGKSQWVDHDVSG